MRVHLGSDHAGLELKNHLAEHLAKAGHEVVDHGPAVFDPEDDYPPFCLRAAAAVVADGGAGVTALGIVIGGSGNGEQIAANKVEGVRAALAWSVETARLAREHNDANVVGIGARMHPDADAVAFAETFLSTPFTGAERHSRRIRMVSDYESSGLLPPVPDSPAGPGSSGS
jgi:ribose 5-phosphate isomerase B